MEYLRDALSRYLDTCSLDETGGRDTLWAAETLADAVEEFLSDKRYSVKDNETGDWL